MVDSNCCPESKVHKVVIRGWLMRSFAGSSAIGWRSVYTANGLQKNGHMIVKAAQEPRTAPGRYVSITFAIIGLNSSRNTLSVVPA
jgi:hypothetical protein